MTRDLNKPEHLSDELFDLYNDILSLQGRFVDAREAAPNLAGLKHVLDHLSGAAHHALKMQQLQERSLAVSA